MRQPIALVTGSAGFVGSHFVRRLKADGWGVVEVDIAAEPVPWVGPVMVGPDPVVAKMDCRDFFRAEATRDWFVRMDLVIHCAAVVGGRATIEGQPMKVATDLAIDADLWQWALRTRPGRVVYFSSSAAYPTELQTWTVATSVNDMTPVYVAPPDARPLTETDIDLDDIAHPDQTYGLAKLVGEIQAAHVRAEGVPVTVVRPFSGYGPDQDLDYPFPSFIDRATRRADPFDIWGDGGQVRDFIHIDDIVNAVMVCVEQGVDGPVNLCTGRPTSFNELADIVCSAAGYEPERQHHPDAPTGVRYRVGDPTLLHDVWRPRIPLEEGVARALDLGSRV